MKNVFYFSLKALFVLKIFKFLSCLFGHVENGLIGKMRLNSKFMTSQHRKQAIAMQILSNISRIKGNQAMKLSQLIEYNMTNMFLENHTQNMVEKLFTDPFLKNQNLAYL